MAATDGNVAQVAFSVECNDTKFGDQIMVVGSHSLLGKWEPLKGIVLTTTMGTFPSWSSTPISVPAHDQLEYKFVIVPKAGKATAAWEGFEANRNIVPQAGKVSTAFCKWNQKDHSYVQTTDLPSAADAGSEEVQGSPRGLDEGCMFAMKERVEYAETLGLREARRKNFSQSLLDVVDSDVEEEEQPPQPVAPSPLRNTARRHSVGLKHITSFSALVETAAAAEKEEARAAARRVPTYAAKNLAVPVVIVTSEVAPYSKTGGLGLVAASYSYEFARKGHRTMTVAPKYKHYDNLSYAGETKVYVNGNAHEVVKYWHKHENGCDFVFVEHPAIEKGGGLYSDDNGQEYSDNLFRFTLLSLAALEAPLVVKLKDEVYGQNVMFLANDWQAGLVPLYLAHKYRPNNTYCQARCIYVVHNLGYQGQYFGIEACKFFGVPPPAAHDLAFNKSVNLSKAALICADRVLTVSENYCKEIQTHSGGFKLEEHVRAKAHANRLEGILNGIDDCWNPEADKSITERYSVKNFVSGKAANKVALQKQLGLAVNDKQVLIGFVGRLTWQKGVDVLTSIVDWLMADTGNGVNGQIQLIMMGNGEKAHGTLLSQAEAKYPGRVCGYVGFSPKVEHQMMAGCDLFLMPSRYEPCGLPQMYSQRYGTLPIVTATGGLVDSVKDVAVGCDKATGFHMSHLDAGKMKEVVYNAARLCLQEPEKFRQMQETAMQEDFYWPQAMDRYEQSIDRTLAEACMARP